MQAKLHRWAVADPGRRFEDLFNFVHDPATLMFAFERVTGNRGANTPGADGMSAAWVEENIAVSGFLEDLRTIPAASSSGSTRSYADGRTTSGTRCAATPSTTSSTSSNGG